MHIFILEKKHIGIHVVFPKLLHMFKPGTISYCKNIMIGMRKMNTLVIKLFSKRKKRIKKKNEITGVVLSPRRAVSHFDPCNGRPNPSPKTLLLCFPVLWLSPHLHWFQSIYVSLPEVQPLGVGIYNCKNLFFCQYYKTTPGEMHSTFFSVTSD